MKISKNRSEVYEKFKIILILALYDTQIRDDKRTRLPADNLQIIKIKAHDKYYW